MSSLKLRILQGGHCKHPQHLVLQNRSLRPMCFPSLYAVLEHPCEGLCLFDTGYSSHFLEATRPFPERFYAWLTPVTVPPEQTALHQLSVLGYAPEDVQQVFISHFHADHISALADFPQARFRYCSEAFDAARYSRRVQALRRGILPALLPPDFLNRSDPLRGLTTRLPDECSPFDEGLNIFGDGSCWVIKLPGHARGQLGLFVTHEDGRHVFLVADACWTREGFELGTRPHPVAHILFDDPRSYHSTLDKLVDLHTRHPELLIVPSHCKRTFEALDLS